MFLVVSSNLENIKHLKKIFYSLINIFLEFDVPLQVVFSVYQSLPSYEVHEMLITTTTLLKNFKKTKIIVVGKNYLSNS